MADVELPPRSRADGFPRVGRDYEGLRDVVARADPVEVLKTCVEHAYGNLNARPCDRVRSSQAPSMY